MLDLPPLISPESKRILPEVSLVSRLSSRARPKEEAVWQAADRLV